MGSEGRKPASATLQRYFFYYGGIYHAKKKWECDLERRAITAENSAKLKLSAGSTLFCSVVSPANDRVVAAHKPSVKTSGW